MLKWLRRWRVLILLAVTLCLFAIADAWLKTAPSPGYCPKNAAWTLAASDIASFYSAWADCDIAKAALPELGPQVADLARRVRLATGIRPTALRYRAWLGSRLLVAYSEDGFGFCVRPGLLIRAADLYRRVIQRVPTEEGVRRFGTMYYAWRDGFLVASSSLSYVRASLSSEPEPAPEAPEVSSDLRLAWPGAKATVRFRAEDGLPVEGWIDARFYGRSSSGLSLPEAWPEPPLISVGTFRWSNLNLLASMALEAVESAGRRTLGKETYDRFALMASRWTEYFSAHVDLEALPRKWARSVDECAFAVQDIGTDGAIPIPELALILHNAGPVPGPHPFLNALPSENAVAHEWSGRPGTAIPWLGAEMMLCFATRDRHWFLTTQEPLMAELIGARIPDAPRDADVVITLDWAKAGRCVESMLTKAGEFELIPHMNQKDLASDWMPYVRAAACLGTLDIEAKSQEDGRIRVQGFMARQMTYKATE